MDPKNPSSSAPPAPAVTAPVMVPSVGPAVKAAASRSKYEAIARVAHEVNRELTAHAGDVPVQPHWEEASEDTRLSCINGVEFFEKNPLASPEDAHNNWCAKKIADGWVLNGIYSAESKTHPHLRAYGSLAPEVRLKDKVYRAIVTTMLKL